MEAGALVPQSPRMRHLRRFDALKKERESFRAHHIELSEQFSPRRSRFLDDQNKSRRSDKIINFTVRKAARILASGMMAGITSPARPWFRLTTDDPKLADYGSVKRWLYAVEEILRTAIARSNLYNALHNVYEDLPIYGIAALHIEDDEEDLLRGYVHPIGSYAIAQDGTGRVRTVYREYRMTVEQIVGRFCTDGRGKVNLDRCSEKIRQCWERNELDEWVKILHVVCPNRGYKAGRLGPAGKRYASCWMEQDGRTDLPFLSESGFEELPTLVARWDVNGEDIYGSSCPGMDALGDAKGMQWLERKKGAILDKIIDPPMGGPEALLHREPSLMPGDFTPLPLSAQGQKIEPLIRIDPGAFTAAVAEIREHERRVEEAFYADLWLMLSRSDGNMTAREVAERHEEKMLQLGPVLERLQDELLDPLIDRVYQILDRRGAIPPPPPELLQRATDGSRRNEVKIEYVSIIAQAQKLLGLSGIEKHTGYVIQLGAARPDALDLLNVDELVRAHGASSGIPPNLLHDEEEVAAARAERAKQAAQEQAMQQGMAMSQGAKNLAGASLEGNNALGAMLDQMGAPVPPGVVQ